MVGQKHPRKRDKLLHVLKRISVKFSPIYRTVRRIINPRSVFISFLLSRFISPKPALALSLEDVTELAEHEAAPTVTFFLATQIPYHSAYLIPGIARINSDVVAPIAVVGGFGCHAGSVFFSLFGFHEESLKLRHGAAAFAGYVEGARVANPTMISTVSATLNSELFPKIFP